MFDTNPYEEKMNAAFSFFQDELKKGANRQGARWNA